MGERQLTTLGGLAPQPLNVLPTGSHMLTSMETSRGHDKSTVRQHVMWSSGENIDR